MAATGKEGTMPATAAWRLALVFTVLAAGPAAAAGRPPRPAPSFDCRKATHWTEKAVCSDVKLAALDRRLARVFAEARRELAPHTETLLDEQRAWLDDLKDCSCDGDQECEVECLSSRFEQRARQLLADLPLVADLRQPVSAAQAERLFPIFRLMTQADLDEVTSRDNREALAEASCRYFERFPRQAAALFGVYDYSSRDSWNPLCRTIDVAAQVPAVPAVPATAAARRLVDVLDLVSGSRRYMRCVYVPTMQYGIDRTEMVARIMAVVDGDPDVAAYERERARAFKGLGYRPGLAHWAMQGLWQQRRYREVRLAVTQARPALAADYARRFHLDAERAAKLAGYHVERLIEVYAGRSGAGSTLDYYSLCLTTADLDRYLATGRVPDKRCPQAEFADPSPRATLRRLLGLAIVNGYPTAAVRRLIAGGARLDPPGPKDLVDQNSRENNNHESRESLLMLSAARADVIDALLVAGADPNRTNGFGKTALMYAVQERNLEGVRRLLRGGADANAATESADDCMELPPGGRTALMYAAWQATPAIVEALLAAHADVRRADAAGKTAAAYVDGNRRLSPAERQALKALLR